ncbi:CBS domain-containing protein [Bradyrhizobium sp. 27S5]|uniref:CBS domain-containing protein n=1 Tax=Bradyrhizobium sp. 27S5 TaxID=3139728 RepID=UPI0030D0E537
MRVHQIMARNVISIAPEADMAEAASLMVRHHISGLPVVDGRHALVGILSESDFLRRSEIGTQRKRARWLELILGAGEAAENYVHERGCKVAEIMTAAPITVDEQVTLAEVVEIMERNNIKRVPVVQDGKLAGIVTRSDLMQAAASLAGRVADPTTDDERIRAQVVEEIENKDWCPSGLNVIVKDGILHLSGTIFEEPCRTAAIVAAENVKGVVKVHDHLRRFGSVYGLVSERSPEDEEWAQVD